MEFQTVYQKKLLIGGTILGGWTLYWAGFLMSVYM